jgi:hypothetical protein
MAVARAVWIDDATARLVPGGFWPGFYQKHRLTGTRKHWTSQIIWAILFIPVREHKIHSGW